MNTDRRRSGLLSQCSLPRHPIRLNQQLRRHGSETGEQTLPTEVITSRRQLACMISAMKGTRLPRSGRLLGTGVLQDTAMADTQGVGMDVLEQLYWSDERVSELGALGTDSKVKP